MNAVEIATTEHTWNSSTVWYNNGKEKWIRPGAMSVHTGLRITHWMKQVSSRVHPWTAVPLSLDDALYRGKYTYFLLLPPNTRRLPPFEESLHKYLRLLRYPRRSSCISSNHPSIAWSRKQFSANLFHAHPPTVIRPWTFVQIHIK